MVDELGAKVRIIFESTNFIDIKPATFPVFCLLISEISKRLCNFVSKERSIMKETISHDKEKCEAYIKEQDDRERAFVLEYLNAHGLQQYTMDDVLRQEVWQQNQCCDWNHCYVHEITLVE